MNEYTRFMPFIIILQIDPHPIAYESYEKWFCEIDSDIVLLLGARQLNYLLSAL